METKTLSIECPVGYEIDKGKSTFEKIVFKQKQLKPLTFKEILEAEDNKEGFWVSSRNINKCILTIGFSLTDCRTESDAKKALAFIKYLRVASYYNDNYAEGEKVDWGNDKNKWYIYYNKCWNAYTVGANNNNNLGGIYFATSELAEMMIDNNRDILDEFYLGK